MKKILTFLVRVSITTLMSIVSSSVLSQTTSTSETTSAFEKTDSSLLFEIGRDFNTNKKGKSTAKKRPLTPKEIRISTAKESLNWMILKKSSSNGIIGGVVGAMATVHPIGLLLGGVSGAYQGKSTRYEEAQGKLHKMEQEILKSNDYELTPEEIRLASYAGTELYEKLSITPPSKKASSDTKDINSIVAMPKAIPLPKQVAIPGCQKLTKSLSSTLSSTQKRILSTKCFYGMN